MTKFILVILMTSGGTTSQSGVAISQQQFGPFDTREACVDARVYYTQSNVREYLDPRRSDVRIIANCWPLTK